ncbi:MAG: hypothetical protein M1826_003132 [Phylliscum demangeonii]|nr:MAG: hypothetical protein M1826_003132 [Phylliscum demangeonii]
MDAQALEARLAFWKGDAKGTEYVGTSLAALLRLNHKAFKAFRPDPAKVLFPLPEWNATDNRLDNIPQAFIDAFQDQVDLRRNMRNAFVRYMKLFAIGFEYNGDRLQGYRWLNTWNAAVDQWLKAGSDFYPLFTRIIRSLRLLNFEPEAAAFWLCLHWLYNSSDNKKTIDPGSYRNWTIAAKGDPYLLPDRQTNHVHIRPRDFNKTPRKIPRGGYEDPDSDPHTAPPTAGATTTLQVLHGPRDPQHQLGSPLYSAIVGNGTLSHRGEEVPWAINLGGDCHTQ